MTTIKIAFTSGGEAYERAIRNALSENFSIIRTYDNPDLCVIAFANGNVHRNFRCKHLQITGENAYPRFDIVDYAISCHDINFGNRHKTIPFFVFNKEYEILTKEEIEYDERLYNREFCSAVISDDHLADPFRLNFTKQLDSTRRVFSFGKAYHNCNITLDDRPANAESLDGRYTNPNKIGLIGNFKFNLAMENSSVDGYVTEKITDAFAARTIPIYWGADDVTKYINKDSFINVKDYKDFSGAYDEIMRICENKDAYMKMLTADKIVKKDMLSEFKDFMLNVIDGRTYEHDYGNLYYK